MVRKYFMRTAIDVNSSRIEKLISDKLSPLQAVQGCVNGFFTHSDRVRIKHIRMSNEVYQPTSTSDRPKRSKRKK